MSVMNFDVEERQLPFRIEDDSSANWAMRKYAALVQKIRENERIANAELERIAKWLEAENSKLASDASFFEEHLKDYGRRQRNEKDRKSIKLPYGAIKSRQTQPRIEVDEAVFIPWAQQNQRDDLLSYAPPKPNKTALKAEADIPGVVVVEGSVSFSVEVDNVN